MGFRRRRAALAAAAAIIAVGTGLGVWLAAGSGGSKSARPADDPIVFLRGVVRQIAANDYDGAWLKLHPAQQRVATRAAYVQCEELSPIPGHLDWIRLVGSKDVRITVAGNAGVVDSTAATFNVRLSGLGQALVVKMTAHAVAVGGQWRWILSPKRFAQYQAKRCPGIARSPPSATA